ncbi:sigma 54-interacting transcriptional regulator [uncultured Tissierella sp.]|uniref:sigma-54 interaction domain-containing protein n=1 Tax=uncultured Tissierella sp. TaxID=448160 RepID=UPI0028062EAD|nr:sigma 54-interacting transcriptional regulator [uncultured Tissierella sp.]MDU5081424.1 sigma 54-interacting transcriptional regulator [Bacillota bacterium]
MINELELQEYYDLAQKIAEAIEAVLNLDVTMMNENMDRIAGTGIYKKELNNKIAKNSAFESCLLSDESFVIINHCKNESIYNRCTNRIHCQELAKICVPIKCKEKIIGVLGVIAFNDEQKHRIQSNRDIYLNYLEKMASLLGGKYDQYQMDLSKKRYAQRMNGILNTINSGVILYTDSGEVLYTNNALEGIFAEVGIENIDDFVSEIRKHKKLQELLESGQCIRPCEIAIDILGIKYTLLVTITYLNMDSNSKEIMLTIQNIDYFKKQVMQSIEKNHIRLKFDNILGISKEFLEVKRLAEKAALSESNILIQGESGTGKELFARAIHNSSDRRDFAFVPINCGAIPYDLFESEFFGYEKGAFTGAYANKIGKFEVADKGTVFLDEIGDIPYDLQVKLLRILQEKEVCRIGSNVVKKVDVKIIAASNKDLLKRVKEGLFREDLYYRLNVIPIMVPPLVKRHEDILYIANHFIKYYSKLLNKDIRGLTQEAINLMMEYHWPGNVREMQNLIEYACNFETGSLISSQVIEKRLEPKNEGFTKRFDGESLSISLGIVEKEIIIRCINKYSCSNTKDQMISCVCKELDISRATLYRKIKEYNICLNHENYLNNETIDKKDTKRQK